MKQFRDQLGPGRDTTMSEMVVDEVLQVGCQRGRGDFAQVRAVAGTVGAVTKWREKESMGDKPVLHW